MDIIQFDRLLYEEESDTLDFKVEQYRFANADEHAKSELLKDLLGFANAWRRADAFILVGVRDVRGGRAEVVGIADTEHLDDHSLQQFVNNLTNRPLRFNYEAFSFEGKQVGIVRIDQQPRPIFLKKDFGKLKRNAVYVRRGSSTDPTHPADPVEIAQMGSVLVSQGAEVCVEFAAIDCDKSVGTSTSCEVEYCKMPAADEIPELDDSRNARDVIYHPDTRINAKFYREMAKYVQATRWLAKTRLCVKNAGQVPATRVRIELSVPHSSEAEIVEQGGMPDLPRSWFNARQFLRTDAIHAALRRTPGELSVDRDNERIRVIIDCGDLQPGRQVMSDTFFTGKRTSGELTLSGQVFADNLSIPKDVSLSLSFNVKQTEMSLDELIIFACRKSVGEI